MNSFNFNILINAGELALKRQKEDGSLPVGKNGPHDHIMTTARNTGHFAILFLYLYKKTFEDKWRIAGQKALDHLLKLRPIGGCFWHRKEDFKSSYNGLIGQAWSLEALLYGHGILHDDNYLNAAKEVINIHIFDEKESLWYEADLDGSARPLCTTLNQQIWFMAFASKICIDNPKIQNYGKNFLANIGRHMKIHRNGLLDTKIIKYNFSYWRRIYEVLFNNRLFLNRQEIETGYHIFTVTGLALLYEQYRGHWFYESKKFLKVLNYCFSEDYAANLQKYPKYGFEYNVVGFELPYIFNIFNFYLNEDAKSNMLQCYNKQLEYYASETDGLLACNSSDIETLAARIYEIYRIDDIRTK